MDSLILYLNKEESLKGMLMAVYAREGNYGEARTLANDLLGDDTYASYAQVQLIMMDMDENGNNYSDSLNADETLRNMLIEIADNREDYGSSHARALLSYALGYEYSIIIEALEQGLQQRPENTTKVVDNLPTLEAKVKVYPNPSAGYVNVEYELEANKTGIFKVYNALGQLIMEKQLLNSNGTMQIEIPGSTGAIYYYRLEADGVSIERGKMAVIK